MAKISYTKEFFSERVGHSNHTAGKVHEILRKILPQLNSVVDVGCGTGSWLAEFKNCGIETIKGYDGYLNSFTFLEIPKKDFSFHNLKDPIISAEKFDLAICLEVAEHLYEDDAHTLIRSVCSLSDFILFSAAIPGQGGQNHFNERWQSYWIDLFTCYNFTAFDCIRSKIWDDPKIPFWYKQNSFLMVKKNTNFFYDINNNSFIADLVHPELFHHKCTVQGSSRGSFKTFLKEIFCNK